MGKTIAVIGTTGGIGEAVVSALLKRDDIDTIYSLSRSEDAFTDDRIISLHADITDEASVKQAADVIDSELDMVFIATGMLHTDTISPEKSMRDMNAHAFAESYLVNTVGPALIGKHFLPKFPRDRRAVFAALSARVGSVSDNQIGGWYAYRASKAALNMILKNFAIEMGRKYKEAIIVGLQPGTVDTKLSEPFQSQVKRDHLFTPEYSAEHLLKVLDGLTPQDSGKLYDWSGESFAP